jgi:hypothetical protein
MHAHAVALDGLLPGMTASVGSVVLPRVTRGLPVRHDPPYQAVRASRLRVNLVMRRLPLAVPAALLAAGLAACSSSSSPAASTPPATSAPAATTAAAAAPDATLGALTLGHFPSTTDGRTAKGLCQAWSALRTQYASNVQNDSPVSLNQWFSGPDWAAARSEAGKLGNAPAYSSLVAAYGVATVGDTASIDTARNVDKACAAG